MYPRSTIFLLKNTTQYRDLHEYFKSDLGTSKFLKNYKKILQDSEFENILTIQSIWIKFSVDMCENLKLNYKQIQKLIEIKYPDVDYSKLGENIKKGFWG